MESLNKLLPPKQIPSV